MSPYKQIFSPTNKKLLYNSNCKKNKNNSLSIRSEVNINSKRKERAPNNKGNIITNKKLWNLNTIRNLFVSPNSIFTNSKKKNKKRTSKERPNLSNNKSSKQSLNILKRVETARKNKHN